MGKWINIKIVGLGMLTDQSKETDQMGTGILPAQGQRQLRTGSPESLHSLCSSITSPLPLLFLIIILLF